MGRKSSVRTWASSTLCASLPCSCICTCSARLKHPTWCFLCKTQAMREAQMRSNAQKAPSLSWVLLLICSTWHCNVETGINENVTEVLKDILWWNCKLVSESCSFHHLISCSDPHSLTATKFFCIETCTDGIHPPAYQPDKSWFLFFHRQGVFQHVFVVKEQKAIQPDPATAASNANDLQMFSSTVSK